MRIAQWAPSGNALDGVPSQIMRVLASDDGKTFGYGYGPGWTMMFGSEHGDISVNPREWVVRYDDGTVAVVSDEDRHEWSSSVPEKEQSNG